MKLGVEVARDLARLQTTLITMVGGPEGEAAHQQLQGHCRIADKLRQSRDTEAEGGADAFAECRTAELPGHLSEDLLADIPGGAKAVEELTVEGTSTIAGRLFRWLIRAILAGDRPKVIIHGPGGCGKSHFIRAAVTALRNARIPISITAPTGCAAFLINGATMHSRLALPITNKSYGRASDAPPPTGAPLQSLREYWRSVRLLVIDEFSMVSEETLRIIDARLQHVRGKQGTPFGGLAIILSGDLYQLPPPGGLPLFDAQVIWRLFHVVELEGNHRAAEDPVFAAMLARVRVGQPTKEDVQLLKTRWRRKWDDDIISSLSTRGAPALLPRRQQVAEENERALSALAAHTKVDMFTCPAEDTYAKNGHSSPPENSYPDAADTGGLEMQFKIAEGARVMLRMNLDIPDGLVNGATGWVEQLDFDEDNIAVIGIWVRFDRGGKRWMDIHGTPAVLIQPHTAHFIGKLDSDRIRRIQFPLVLSWAKTIHKSQGATESKGIMATLDRHAKSTPGLAYVALSRCQRLQDVHLRVFNEECIKAPPGESRALAQLKLQQVRIASTRDKA